VICHDNPASCRSVSNTDHVETHYTRVGEGLLRAGTSVFQPADQRAGRVR